MAENWTRRQFVRASAATAVTGVNFLTFGSDDNDGWHRGDLMHLIPSANHNRLLIKCSFRLPRSAPILHLDGRTIVGQLTDSSGRYFVFDVSSLAANKEYSLQLFDKKARALCDSWPLKTFPAPNFDSQSMRLLTYTCAGGYPDYPFDEQPFLSIAQRQRLLRRALSFKPDVLIANGDHVYWDQRTLTESDDPRTRELARLWYQQFGELDLHQPAKGTQNESIIKRAVEPQISALYGVTLRSTPSFFVGDDHDYFEDDRANEKMVTLPPSSYQRSYSRFTRDLFLPEFLPDALRPPTLSGSGAADRPDGVSESFGTLRYGRLLEALIYDCARYLSLKGVVGGLVPPDAERWIQRRTADEYVRHLIHVPSHPFGYSAGKWREWYPDVADVGANSSVRGFQKAARSQPLRLTTEREKYLWQPGWLSQHQRLIESLRNQRNRPGIIVSGDLHATGHSLMTRSRNIDLGTNPVHAILSGPIGTGTGWPSAARGTPPKPAIGVDLEELTSVREKNGFTVLDIDQNTVEVKLFEWKRGQPEQEIDHLNPFHTYRIKRKA